MLSVLHSFPDVPAAEIIDDFTLGVFDLVPFENLDSRFFDETSYVEYLSERNRSSVTPYVGWCKHGQNGNPIGDNSKVDEIRVCDDIICCTENQSGGRHHNGELEGRTPSCRCPGGNVLCVTPEVLAEARGRRAVHQMRFQPGYLLLMRVELLGGACGRVQVGV